MDQRGMTRGSENDFSINIYTLKCSQLFSFLLSISLIKLSVRFLFVCPRSQSITLTPFNQNNFPKHDKTASAFSAGVSMVSVLAGADMKCLSDSD